MIFGKYKRILNNQTDSFHVLNKNLTDGLCQDNIIFDWHDMIWWMSAARVTGTATTYNNDKWLAVKCWWEPTVAAYINRQGGANLLFKKGPRSNF